MKQHQRKTVGPNPLDLDLDTPLPSLDYLNSVAGRLRSTTSLHAQHRTTFESAVIVASAVGAILSVTGTLFNSSGRNTSMHHCVTTDQTSTARIIWHTSWMSLGWQATRNLVPVIRR
eukprot:2214103-Amphidinium_carterae.1